MLIEIYCDGSSEGNSTGKGGWAYVICKDGTKILEGSGHLPKATNNVAEITAAIEGLRAASLLPEVICGAISGNALPDVVLISDSQLTLRYATGEYICRKYHLIPLYIELKRQYQKLGATTRWVKGHAGDVNNERCDKLAKAAKENNAIINTVAKMRIKSIRALSSFLGKLGVDYFRYENGEWYFYQLWKAGKAPTNYVPPRGHIVGPQYRYGWGIKESIDWLTLWETRNNK